MTPFASSSLASNRPRTQIIGNKYGTRSAGLMGKIQSFNVDRLKMFANVSNNTDRNEIKTKANQLGGVTQKDGGAFFDNGEVGYYYNFINHNAGGSDKYNNLMSWRQMAMDVKVGNALDDICDASIQPGAESRPYRIDILNPQVKSNENMAMNIQREFERFMAKFNFKRNGWTYFRDLFVDAEVAWELVYDENDPTRGIVGVKRLQTDKLIVVRNQDDLEMIEGYMYTRNDGTNVLYHPNQVVYVGSGIWTEDKQTQVPFIHRAMKVWRQLGLMEDASVIYRIVRAPERRVFVVDVGDMPKARAEEHIKGMISKYRQKKVYDPKTGQISGQYNPISMSEDYWFSVRNGAGGTKVDTLAGGKNLSEIEDIEYFAKQFYLALRVPVGRDSTGKNAAAGGGGGEVQRDEIKFSRMIMREQDKVASAVYEGFVVHLGFTGMWDQYGLEKEDLEISFTEPSYYRERLEMEILNLRADTYAKFSNDEFFHKEYLARRILKMSQSDIAENESYKKKALAAKQQPPDAGGGASAGGSPLSFGSGGPSPEGTPEALGGQDGEAPPMDLSQEADQMPAEGEPQP
jgi:Bacteriophage T4-like portal protein (Gp20)